MQADTALPDGKAVAVDGHTIYTWQTGSGEPVIFLHGLGNSAYNWRKNLRPVGSAFKAIAMDLPGHGKSDLVWFSYTLKDAAAFAMRFADALNVERMHLAGSSLGGAIALHAALAYPGRVRSLTLVDSVGLGREIGAFLRLACLPFVGEYGHRASERSIRSLLRLLLYDDSLVEESAVQEILAFRRRPGAVKGVLRMLRAGVSLFGQRPAVQMQGRMGELRMPLLAVWGRQDPIVPLSAGQLYHDSIPGSRLSIIDNCGHRPEVEKPDEFIRVVQGFLRD